MFKPLSRGTLFRRPELTHAVMYVTCERVYSESGEEYVAPLGLSLWPPCSSVAPSKASKAPANRTSCGTTLTYPPRGPPSFHLADSPCHLGPWLVLSPPPVMWTFAGLTIHAKGRSSEGPACRRQCSLYPDGSRFLCPFFVSS